MPTYETPTPTPWKSWSGCSPGMLNWSGLQKKVAQYS